MNTWYRIDMQTNQVIYKNMKAYKFRIKNLDYK